MTAKGRATRRRLLEAAADELTESGRIEVLTVAQRAQVTPSIIYRYFASKDGLVTALVEAFYDEYDREVFSVMSDPDVPWLDAEAARISREVAFVYTHPLARAVIAGAVHEAAATRVDAARQREQIATATRNIEYAQRTGQLPTDIDAGVAAAALLGALRSIATEVLTRQHPPESEDVSTLVTAIGRRILGVE